MVLFVACYSACCSLGVRDTYRESSVEGRVRDNLPFVDTRILAEDILAVAVEVVAAEAFVHKLNPPFIKDCVEDIVVTAVCEVGCCIKSISGKTGAGPYVVHILDCVDGVVLVGVGLCCVKDSFAIAEEDIRAEELLVCTGLSCELGVHISGHCKTGSLSVVLGSTDEYAGSADDVIIIFGICCVAFYVVLDIFVDGRLLDSVVLSSYSN